MLKAEIKPGNEYAVREKRTPGIPFQRVRILEHIRGNKWKAKWVDPNPGLVDYIESGQLIVPWREHKAFLKEEENERRLREYNLSHGYDNKRSPVYISLEQVFQSMKDGIDFRDGCAIGSPESLERVKTRARLTHQKNKDISYLDRQGNLHIPFDQALSVGAALQERSHSGSIPDDIEMLTPWRIIEDSPEIQNRVEHLSARLASDVPPKHVLYGLKARAVATRIDRDDVLFEVEGGEKPLAVVHMSWRKETDPRWPSTRLFQSWEQWVRDEMLPAHEGYGPS